MGEPEGGGASRTTQRAAGSSSATDISLREYFEALRHSDDKTDHWIWRFYEERDRRLYEVNVEREKALKIKETADLAALGLAREIQTYKDEKANELRAQIESERGRYVTQEQFKPVADYVTATQGRASGIGSTATWIFLAVSLVFAGLSLYFGTR